MLLSPTRVRFLNEEREIASAADWNAQPQKKNWLYNLHYFDDLNARDAQQRRSWHENLIHRWIAENSPGLGFGWDPYPLSVRIMNWIKWALWGNELSPEAIQSLAVQVRYLFKHYDYHLLGNHLLVNGKAFVFAGLFCEGPEADRWLQKGLRILTHQIPQQILPDGGHFERSPMYHNLIVEDLLDLINLFRVYGRDREFGWHQELMRMRHWAAAMAHPDGDIALFGDSAFGIALPARTLDEYAQRLGLPSVENSSEQSVRLKESGYVRAVRGPVVLVANVGSLAPDYLPGHSHADTLSFELSWQGKRIIVDSGTSLYDITPERLRQRGTGAHNTVQIDGQDSSEVWSSFRVARRAKVKASEMISEGGIIRIRGVHDGYCRLSGGGLHRRTWSLGDKSLEITDEIGGRNAHDVNLQFHFHPGVRIVQKGTEGFEIHAANGSLIRLEMDPILTPKVEDATYHPEFGLSIPNKKVVGVCQEGLPLKLITRFSWS